MRQPTGIASRATSGSSACTPRRPTIRAAAQRHRARSLVIDGLLGSGVRGPLRDPIAQAVEVCRAARRLGVPVLAIDTPTAVDLTSGTPSEPGRVANVTVTFHRPKQGL